MNDRDLSREILRLVGGKTNVTAATHCMTRLRLTLADPKRVNARRLKTTDGVLGLVCEDTSLQIILGPGRVHGVSQAFKNAAGLSDGGLAMETGWYDHEAAVHTIHRESGTERLLHGIADILLPLVPAVLAVSVFSLLGMVLPVIFPRDTGVFGGIISFCRLISWSFLGYFTIFIGVRCAEFLGATPALGGMIGAVSMSTRLAGFARLYRLPESAVLEPELPAQIGNVLCIMATVWIMAKLERWIRRRIHSSLLDLIVTPLVCLTAGVCIYVFALMPVNLFLCQGIMAPFRLLFPG